MKRGNRVRKENEIFVSENKEQPKLNLANLGNTENYFEPSPISMMERFSGNS